jgi:DNA-binding MarR family transcriptional regulator
MKIEEELKQNKFETEYQKLGLNILFTGGWVNLKNVNYLKKYDISPQQYNVLRILKGQHPNPVTLNLIMDRMVDKTSNVSRLVEKLRLKGLLERKQCERNRRAVDIVITTKGINLLQEINNQTIFEDTFKTLSVDEAVQLNNLLNKLRS